MNIDKTTIGGYALATGLALGAGVAALPSEGYDNIRVPMGVLAAILATGGSALLGHSATDSTKVVTTKRVAEVAEAEGKDTPLTARKLVKSDPADAVAIEPTDLTADKPL